MPWNANNRLLNIFNHSLSYCRIFHTVILDDPYDDPPQLSEHIPDRSPEPTKEQLEVKFTFTRVI